MPWWGWVWIALATAESMFKVALVGKPRKPLSRGDAAASVALLPFAIWFIVVVAQR